MDFDNPETVISEHHEIYMGKIVNLYGQESAGKTTLALTIAASTINRGGWTCYVDWEHSLDMSYAKAINVPVEDKRFRLYQPNTMEKGLGVIWAMAKRGIDLIVIDSVGAGVPKSVEEQAIDEKGGQGQVGLVARKWSEYLPQLAKLCSKTGSCVIGISQLRKKIGQMTGYGPDTHAQGGEAWKFYSSVRMGLTRVASEKGKVYNPLKHCKEEGVIGGTIKARMDKCKISASQGRFAEFYIRHGEGIDDVRSIIEIASKHGIIKKSGASLAWEMEGGVGLSGRGMEDFKTQIKAAPGAWDQLYKTTLVRLGAANLERAETDSAPSPEEEVTDIETIMTGEKKKEPATEE